MFPRFMADFNSGMDGILFRKKNIHPCHHVTMSLIELVHLQRPSKKVVKGSLVILKIYFLNRYLFLHL